MRSSRFYSLFFSACLLSLPLAALAQSDANDNKDSSKNECSKGAKKSAEKKAENFAKQCTKSTSKEEERVKKVDAFATLKADLEKELAAITDKESREAKKLGKKIARVEKKSTKAKEKVTQAGEEKKRKCDRAEEAKTAKEALNNKCNPKPVEPVAPPITVVPSTVEPAPEFS